MDAGRSSSANLASAVGTTLAAQGQRVAAFKAWDAAIAEYLKEGDAVVYRQQCEQCTAAFRACSETVKRCVVDLQQASHPAASLLQRLQGLEQRKLGLVAQLHLLQEQVMLRTAGGARACDATARVEPRSDAEFVREVAAAVASDEKVQELRGEARELQTDIEDACDDLRALLCDEDDD